MKRYLLDTHTALWWADDNSKLGANARRALENPSSEIYLSAVSVWEVSIKCGQGKLSLPHKPLEFFNALVNNNNFKVLPISISHSAEVFDLPKLHNDPFDRLLVAQAKIERLILLSNDKQLAGYKSIKLLW